MYRPIDAVEAGGQAPDDRYPVLGRLRSGLLVAGFCACVGAAIAAGALPFLAAPFSVGTQLAVSGASEDRIRVALEKLHAGPVLDNVIHALNLERSNDFAVNRPTIAAILTDVMSGEVTTVSQAEDAMRKRLRDAVATGYDAAGRRIEIDATASSPEMAAAIAGRLVAEFRRLIAEDPGQPRSPQVEAMRKAAERAEAALSGFVAKLDAATREKLQSRHAQRSGLDAEIAGRQKHLSELEKKRDIAASMTVADILSKPLPDSLEFTGLEYERQRHVQAELTLQQLSASLGPRHPRRAAAQATLDDATRDLGTALRQLSASLKDQAATEQKSLAELKATATQISADPALGATERQLSTLRSAASEAAQNLRRAQAAAPQRKASAAPVLQVLAPASPASASRIGPVPSHLVGAGAGLGFVAGLALALLRHRRQTRLARRLDDLPVRLDLDEQDLLGAAPSIDDDWRDPAFDEVDDEDHAAPAPFRHEHAAERYRDDYDYEDEERIAANDSDAGDTAFGDRMRSLLLENRRPASDAALPPLMAALVDQSLQRRKDAPRNDDAELLELQRELAQLRRLVALHDDRRLKVTG